MVTDYEAAWIALSEFVAGKTQHGREGLLTKMAELTAEHRVPAGELSLLLRLYGVEIERVREISTEPRHESERFAPGQVSEPDDLLTAHHLIGDHDGNVSTAGRGEGRVREDRAGAGSLAGDGAR